ncbi:MAG: S1 RNA-binding domain-containing protein [Proteobacteria bacterium]|jgi:small subunit ribosomal protein S1|nr:S1 RNA-binding domain-containing protein [Pseudomonadota bacterium]
MRDMFGDDPNDKKDNDFAKMFENSLGGVGKSLRVGDRVQGEVLSIGKDEIFVSTGTIHDGIVMKMDLDPLAAPRKGDVLNLFVTQVKGQQIYLSPKPTSKNIGEDIEDAFDMMLPVSGKVTEVVNGGFRVEIMGKVAFCPISQMDLVRIEQPELYVGKKFEFRITQYGERGRKFVVSRRDLLKEERELSTEEFWSRIPASHQIGQVVEGRVANCASFGAFVEVYPGVQGLVPLGEMSFTRRVVRSDELFKVGDTISVKVKDILPEQRKMTLSYKDAGADPWSTITSKYPVGSGVRAKAIRKENFGWIVEIEEGITALMPKSKSMDVADFNYDKIKLGDLLSLQVSEVRAEDRRMTVVPPRGEVDESWKQFTSVSKSDSFGSLGDQLMQAMKTGKK